MSIKLQKLLLAASLGLAVAVPWSAGTSSAATPDTTAPKAETAHHGRYRVSITNLTRGQILSPVIVATHSRRLEPLWTLGSAASDELAGVAEDAINQPMIDRLMGDRAVRDVQTITGAIGPIVPGETASTVVQGDPWFFSQLSMVSMLVITNDAFTGLNGAALPRFGTAKFTSPAYDAGSEANTEMCDHIPGPPCDNPGVRVPTGAEGYVHVHAGIHGIGTLVPARHDWRNDVAAITVERVR